MRQERNRVLENIGRLLREMDERFDIIRGMFLPRGDNDFDTIMIEVIEE